MSKQYDQIKAAILERIYAQKHLHQRQVKAVIDEVKNHYLWTGKMTWDELKDAVEYFKAHWRDLKEQARVLRRNSSVIGFASYQI